MDYDAFTQALQDRLKLNDRVLGLVAAGSMADASRRDQWSDHDFFVITIPGVQESFRQNLDWLPNADSIVLRFRETEHGLKVMYADGHLLEFAVFDLDEMMVLKANDYEVLFDRADISQRMIELVSASTPPDPDYHKELLHSLSLLQVGAGRYWRGEHMSGHIFIKGYALMHLMPVLIHYLPLEGEDRLDNLDAFRRFEMAFPTVGKQLQAALLLEPPATALKLLDIVDLHLAPLMPDYPQAVVDTLRRYLRSR